MEDLIRYILEHIVTHPEEVTIEKVAEESEYGTRTLYTIHVNPDDIALVIGKQGRTIKSIRNLVKVKAVKTGTYVDVRISEPLPEHQGTYSSDSSE